MVDMVKRLTHRIVAPARVGSIPTIHPTFFLFWGIAKSVRHGTLTPHALVRVQLPQPSDSLAQLVEHLTFNQGVPGSNPGWITNFFYPKCGCGGTGRRARLRIWCLRRAGSIPVSRTNYTEQRGCRESGSFFLSYAMGKLQGAIALIDPLITGVPAKKDPSDG
jgi:hypothetical protein